MNEQQQLDKIACLLERQLSAGYGDPDNSESGSKDTTANWQLLFSSTDLPCQVQLLVTGANPVSYGPNDNNAYLGFPLPINTPLIFEFRGKLWVRSTAGASTIQWQKMGRNVTDPYAY